MKASREENTNFVTVSLVIVSDALSSWLQASFVSQLFTRHTKNSVDPGAGAVFTGQANRRRGRRHGAGY